MPNFVLSAYELISREVESLYLKIPKELNLGVVKQPIFRQTANGDIVRNWKKQHLYVLMTRATVRLAINIEDRALYDYFDRKLSMVRAHG